jgi:4-carboxymuconolactone decarboxylase
MVEKDYDAGLAVRREVLGAEHVDRQLAAADDFNGAIQEMVTAWAWGGIWSRPGLDRKTRSLIVIAMLSALNRPHELRIHLRGALNNGASREEIREVLLQVAGYCGLPAAVDAFRNASALFAEIDGK